MKEIYGVTINGQLVKKTISDEEHQEFINVSPPPEYNKTTLNRYTIIRKILCVVGIMCIILILLHGNTIVLW